MRKDLRSRCEKIERKKTLKKQQQLNEKFKLKMQAIFC